MRNAEFHVPSLDLCRKAPASSVIRERLKGEMQKGRLSSDTYRALTSGFLETLENEERIVLQDTVGRLGFTSRLQRGIPQIGQLDTSLKQRAASIAAQVARVAASVGRIEVTGGRFEPSIDGEGVIGTGWVLSRDLIMTAGHVSAKLLDAATGSFRSDLNPRIDFGEEFGLDGNDRQVRIISATPLPRRPYDLLDFGLLRTSGQLPDPLPLAAAEVVSSDVPVFTIGFPNTPVQGRVACFKTLSCGWTVSSADPVAGLITSSYPNHEGLSGGPVCLFDGGQVVALHHSAQDFGDRYSRASPIKRILAAYGGVVPQSVHTNSREAFSGKTLMEMCLSDLVEAARSGDRELVKTAQAILKAALKHRSR